MPTARLHVHIPEGTWIGDVSRAHPRATFRVLAALAGGDDGAGIVEVTSDDVETVVEQVEEHPVISDVDLLEVADGAALLRFTTARPMLLTAASEAAFPPEMPFTIEDGVARWELTGTRDRMSDLADALRGMGIDFDVDYVGSGDDDEPILSDTQHEALEAAVEHGYYDTPRGITLSELADEVGVAKSTLSEVLHRAEGTIVRSWLGEDGAAADEE